MTRTLLPEWLRTYRRGDLPSDLTAGFTTAVMLVPQAMAYAMLAGLPPIVGLYAATVPLALYAVFATSRHLAVGPVAMVSLLVASGVGALAEAGSAEYILYAVILAAMVGVIQLVMGLLRLGFLVTLLSHPVISGFTSAAALIIGFSQLKHLFGVDIARSHHVHEIILSALSQIGDIHPVTAIIGALGIALLVGLKRWWPSFPRALAVVALGALAVWILGLADPGARAVAIVGDVPAGLPPFSWSGSFTLPGLETLRALLPMAIVITLVGFMESISVAKAFARRNRYDIDANRELIALGAANIGAGLFSGYPVTGGFSRTAINAQAGARTPLASLLTAAVVVTTLLFFTPLFYYLPRAVLAAIIMTAVFGLIDLHEVKRLYQVNRADLAMLVLTFVATLALGIEAGIAVGVVASLAWFVLQANRPHVAVLGRLPGTEVYRNVDRFDEARTEPNALIVRIDGPIYFGNTDYLKRTLGRLESGQDHDEGLDVVILDASAIAQIDSSADSTFQDIIEDYDRRGIAFYIAGPTGPVRDAMARSGLRQHIGDTHVTRTVQEAVDAWHGNQAPRVAAES